MRTVGKRVVTMTSTKAARGLALAAALPLLGASVPGCVVGTEPVPTTVVVGTDPLGVLVVEWSIELRTDPADCVLSASDAIQIQVTTVSGLDAGFYQQTCSAFATSITLERGSYTARALLVDVAGQPRTTTVEIPPFTMFGSDELHTPIDFPVDSFF